VPAAPLYEIDSVEVDPEPLAAFPQLRPDLSCKYTSKLALLGPVMVTVWLVAVTDVPALLGKYTDRPVLLNEPV
jgi:hypothetical protein